MITTIENFTNSSKPYIEKLNAFAQKGNLAGTVIIDHLGYKCASNESFEQARAMFEQNSEYIFQSIISERRIAYVKMKQPIVTDLGDLWFVELQDQKPDGSQIEKFDHIEGYSSGISYGEMVEKISGFETIIESKKAHHPTHDVGLGVGFSFKCTHGPLLDKIKDQEMV